jgi:polyisoprenoid-binding protein YceI
MRVFKFSLLTVLLIIICAGIAAHNFSHRVRSLAQPVPNSASFNARLNPNEKAIDSQGSQTFILDSSRSKFMARAFSGGLLWFKGHDHFVAVREFTGEARLTPDTITPASLELTAKAASLVETRDVFTEPQKKIINQELREIVLLPDKYPDIIFKSTNVSGSKKGTNQYDLDIVGALTLHGETRTIKIPTLVTVNGNELRAQGEFSINRSDFKVKATSALHGMIRVRDRVKFEFDIVGHRR